MNPQLSWAVATPTALVKVPSLPDKGQDNFLLCLTAAKEKIGTSPS